MDYLIKLGVVAGVVAALWFGFHTWTNSIERRGAEAQRLADQRELDACNANVAKALDANASLERDLSTLNGQVKLANAGIQRQADLAAKAAKQKETILAGSATALTVLEQDRLAALERAKQYQAKGETCEQTLGYVGDAMRSLAIRELRDRPPKADGGGQQGGGGGGDPRPGTDSVRISP